MAKASYGNFGIGYKFELLGGEQWLRNEITKELYSIFANVFTGVGHKIKHKAEKQLVKQLMLAPEYNSLLGMGNSSLKGHFGITDTSKIPVIVDLIAKMIQVRETKPRKKKNEINIGLTLSLEVVDIVKEIEEMGLGIEVTWDRKELKWLEWLLLSGNKVIIQQYDVMFSSNRFKGISKKTGQPWSRTGEAIMVKRFGGRWRVPPLYQGTSTNNWITRAIDKMEAGMTDIIEEEYKKAALSVK